MRDRQPLSISAPSGGDNGTGTVDAAVTTVKALGKLQPDVSGDSRQAINPRSSNHRNAPRSPNANASANARGAAMRGDD